MEINHVHEIQGFAKISLFLIFMPFSPQTCPSKVLGDQNLVHCMLQYTDKVKVNWIPHHSPQDALVAVFVKMIVDQKITSGQPWEILSAKNDKNCGIIKRYNIPDHRKKWVEVKWDRGSFKGNSISTLRCWVIPSMMCQWLLQVNKDTPTEKKSLQQFGLPLPVLYINLQLHRVKICYQFNKFLTTG